MNLDFYRSKKQRLKGEVLLLYAQAQMWPDAPKKEKRHSTFYISKYIFSILLILRFEYCQLLVDTLLMWHELIISFVIEP